MVIYMQSPLMLSLSIATVSTVFVVVFGIAAAYFGLNNRKYFGILDGILTLPMVLPPTVVGFFLLNLLGREGFIGEFLGLFDISLIFTQTGATIAAIIVSLPIMYKTTLAAFQQVDREIIASARTLGLRERVIFFRLLLPLSKKGIISAAILSFARALGEFGATIMVAGNIPGKTQTMSIKIYSSIQAGNYQEAYSLVGIMMGVSILFMVIVSFLTKDKEGDNQWS